MLVRRIYEEELFRAEQISSVAFEWPIEKQTTLETLRQSIRNPRSRTQKYALSRWAAFDENGEMMCSIGAFPYSVHFDGHTVGMNGIGGVSTLPQHRRKGAIRKCFEHAFAEMKEKKELFSILYPFSAVYYRKFGYEIGPQVVEWSIDFSAIPDYGGIQGEYEIYSPGDDLSDYLKVYHAFSKCYNLSIDREELDFLPFTADPYEKLQYLYLFRNQSGEPKGYFSFFKETIEGKRVMNCAAPFHGVEFCFSDLEGLKAILQFTKRFSANYDVLKVSLPDNIPLQLYLGESNDVKREILFRGMMRVVDVKEVLKLAKYRGDGELCIGITDNSAPWNSGNFRLRFQHGRAVSVIDHADDPDVVMGIGDFSRLIVGCRNGISIDCFPGVSVLKENPAIEQVFYTKSNWFGDFF